MSNTNTISQAVNNIIEETRNRERAIVIANEEIRKAKQALSEAYAKRRKVKGIKNINWKQTCVNMAELVRQLPLNVKFTPTQLAHLYDAAYPEDVNIGVLHLNYIREHYRPIEGIDVMVKGLAIETHGKRTLYYRSSKEVNVACN